MVSIKEEIDGQECEQNVHETAFTRKSELKEYLQKEGYSKESKNIYVKIQQESMFVAKIENIILLV